MKPGKRPSQGDNARDAVAATPAFDLVGRGMAQWRRQRPDIDCSGKAVVGRILALQEIILRAVNTALAPHGLRYPVYAVLAALRVSGEPYRMSPSRLQATMLFTSGGISNLLRRVEEQRYVHRFADPADRRGVLVELTDKGFSAVEAAMADHADAERRLCAMFGEKECETLSALLSQMILLNASGGDFPG
jgi:DNA-binding MarR family transcriptional regulator